ncbi:hypothetical protein B0H19DRAFT_1270236 [Mycena capillaripes]|nr:hypothetical protein B0H19DRAFT_1270236 [Mycena capillaripes]
MSFTTTFVTLVLAVFATAKPTPSILPREDGLVTFCFENGSCFESTASYSAGCVDLPLFSEMVTVSVTAPGLECILSPEHGCLSTLGLTNVESFLCTSDVDLINICFSNTTLGCLQEFTNTDGCANLPRFSSDLTFGSVFLTTPGTECTIFQDADCAGNSAPVADALTTIEVSSLGLSNVESFSCV